MSADYLARLVLPGNVVEEYILGNRDVAFHAHDLGDVGDAAGTVTQALRLDDYVDGRADHFSNRLPRQGVARHGDHHFQT